MNLLAKSLNARVLTTLHVEVNVQYNLADDIDGQAGCRFLKSKDIILLGVLAQLLNIHQHVINDTRYECREVLRREAWIEHRAPSLPQFAIGRHHIVVAEKRYQEALNRVVLLRIVVRHLLAHGWVHDGDEGVVSKGPDVNEEDRS